MLAATRARPTTPRATTSPTTASGPSARPRTARSGSAPSPGCAGSSGGLAATPSDGPRILERGQRLLPAREPPGTALDRHLRAGVDALSRTGELSKLGAPSPLPHDNVLAIFEDGEDNVWVGTQGGLLRLSPSAASTVTTADGAPLSINTIYQDPRGDLLVTASERAAVPGSIARPSFAGPFPRELSRLPVRNVFRDLRGGCGSEPTGRESPRIGRHRGRPVHHEAGPGQRLRAGLLRGPRWRHLDRHRRRPEPLAHPGPFRTSPPRTGLAYGASAACCWTGRGACGWPRRAA